jgi:hypothetical protein
LLYNSRQSQPCRRITNYYEHINNGNREKAYFEAIVMFGKAETAGFGTKNEEYAKQLLSDYMEKFQLRNPNLHVFNAVMHNDEATPHLHIDFIPYYTKGRTNGLKCGVSMNSALKEMGFKSKSSRENQQVAWEENERLEMEKILQKRGFQRDNMEDNGRSYAPVPEYKRQMEENRRLKAENERLSKKNSAILQGTETVKSQEDLNNVLINARKLEEQSKSPLKQFFFSDSNKLMFVISELKKYKIDYFEVDNGFLANGYFKEQIREIEKSYIPPNKGIREGLKDTIERLLLSCENLENLTDKLQAEGYEVKKGKYYAVKPPNAKQFVRLRSLGADYYELALKSRIESNVKYEGNLNSACEKHKDNPLKIQIFTEAKTCMTLV